MTFPRKLLLGVTALLLCTAVFAEKADDLRKWIPGNGMVYGELSNQELENAQIVLRLKKKYPAFQTWLDKGCSSIGLHEGKLNRVVVMFSGNEDSRDLAILFGFDHPFDQQKIFDALDQKGLKDKYEKFSVSGHTGYILKERNELFGRVCIVFVSDRTMLVCPEDSAKEMIDGPKLADDFVAKLQTGKNGVFLRVIPGPAELPPDANVRDYGVEGVLNPDSSLSLVARFTMSDEEAAKRLEMQIRQGMMLGLGLAFADDSELGMDLMSRVKIKRTGAAFVLNAKLEPEMIERLVEYGVDQAAKREQERIEKQKRREERRRASESKRQQQSPQTLRQTAPQNPQPAAPAASSGVSSSR